MVIYWSYIVNWCINAWTSRVYQSEVTEHNICVIEGILWLFSWCPLPSKNNFGSSDPPYWFLRHHWIYVQSLLLCLCSVICARRLALSMFKMLISGWYSVFAYRLKPLKYIFQGCSCNFYTVIFIFENEGLSYQLKPKSFMRIWYKTLVLVLLFSDSWVHPSFVCSRSVLSSWNWCFIDPISVLKGLMQLVLVESAKCKVYFID